MNIVMNIHMNEHMNIDIDIKGVRRGASERLRKNGSEHQTPAVHENNMYKLRTEYVK